MLKKEYSVILFFLFKLYLFSNVKYHSIKTVKMDQVRVNKKKKVKNTKKYVFIQIYNINNNTDMNKDNNQDVT